MMFALPNIPLFRLKKQEEVVGSLFVAVSFVEVFLIVSQSVS